ncbi:MAG: MBL fold metallo-hydrolase [Desulfobacteraceae bacterium]
MKAEILSDLWQVGGAEFSAPEDAAVYLTCFGESAVLIDAGSGKGHSRVVSNISRVLPENTRIEYLLLTHCHFDHTGGAGELRQEFGCKIACHALDPSFLSDPEAYQSSLRKLLDLDADLLCKGHFGVFRGKKAVQEFIRSFLSE